MRDLRKNAEPILLVYVLWIAASSLGAGLLDYGYLKLLGADYGTLILMTLFEFAAPLAALLLFGAIELRKFMVFGVLSRVAAFVLLASMKTPELGYLYFAIFGLPNFLFWVPFNMLYFKRKGEDNAFRSSIYFSMVPFLGVILPALGGVAASAFGFGTLFISTALVYLLTLLAVLKFVKKERFGVDLGGEIASLSGLRSLIMLEGFLSISLFISLPLMVLEYFERPDELGFFASLTAIAAVFASLLFSRVSDREQKRKKYVWVFSVLFGLFLLGCALVTGILWFFALFALAMAAKTLFYPFTMSIVLDNQKNARRIMFGREVLLQIGRIGGVFVSFFLFLATGSLGSGLIVFGLSVLFYPVLLEIKKSKIKIK